MTAAAPSLHRTFGVQKKKAADVLKTPTGFSKGVLGHHPWRMQAEILESVATHRRTAVKSCNASGKTFTAADAVLWWVTTYPDGIAVTTAPTWTQVKKLLWGEIRKSAAGAKVKYPKPSETELMLAEGNYAIGLSTNESTRISLPATPAMTWLSPLLATLIGVLLITSSTSWIAERANPLAESPAQWQVADRPTSCSNPPN